MRGVHKKELPRLVLRWILATFVEPYWGMFELLLLTWYSSVLNLYIWSISGWLSGKSAMQVPLFFSVYSIFLSFIFRSPHFFIMFIYFYTQVTLWTAPRATLIPMTSGARPVQFFVNKLAKHYQNIAIDFLLWIVKIVYFIFSKFHFPFQVRHPPESRWRNLTNNCSWKNFCFMFKSQVFLI